MRLDCGDSAQVYGEDDDAVLARRIDEFAVHSGRSHMLRFAALGRMQHRGICVRLPQVVDGWSGARAAAHALRS